MLGWKEDMLDPLGTSEKTGGKGPRWLPPRFVRFLNRNGFATRDLRTGLFALVIFTGAYLVTSTITSDSPPPAEERQR